MKNPFRRQPRYLSRLHSVALERSRSEAAVDLERGRSESAAMENRLIRRSIGAILVCSGLFFSVLFGALATNRAEAQEPPQAFTPDPAEACEGKEPGVSCWMEISDRPGCYTWNPSLVASETVTWSGECSGGLAQGTGSRQWSHPDDEGNPLVSGDEGELRDGKPHGRWSAYFSNGGMTEGSYEHGEPVGPWINVFADGTVFKGEWAAGRRQGHWTSTYGDEVGGGFYAAGKRHGRWKLLFAANDDETVRGIAEGLYVAGNRNGLWVTRFESGTVHEITWRHGVRHGPSSSHYASGAKNEGPYEEGKKHGYWTERTALGHEMTGSYEDGKKHGTWTERTASGHVMTGSYEDGKKHGTWTRRDEAGHEEVAVFEKGEGTRWLRNGTWTHRSTGGQVLSTGSYRDGERHGAWKRYFDNGRLREEGRYVNGEKHGNWLEFGSTVMTTSDGTVMYYSFSEGQYVRGERHGMWKVGTQFREGQEWRAQNCFSDGRRFFSEGRYEDGQREGAWTERECRYRASGAWVSEISSGTYEAGRREGVWLIGVGGGSPYERPYRNGELHGVVKIRGSLQWTDRTYVEGKEVRGVLYRCSGRKLAWTGTRGGGDYVVTEEIWSVKYRRANRWNRAGLGPPACPGNV